MQQTTFFQEEAEGQDDVKIMSEIAIDPELDILQEEDTLDSLEGRLRWVTEARPQSTQEAAADGNRQAAWQPDGDAKGGGLISFLAASPAAGGVIDRSLLRNDLDDDDDDDDGGGGGDDGDDDDDEEEEEGAGQPGWVRLERSATSEGREIRTRSGVVGVASGGRVEEQELVRWLEEVWFRDVPEPSFLLADSYAPHTSGSVQKLLLQVRFNLFLGPDLSFLFRFYTLSIKS